MRLDGYDWPRRCSRGISELTDWAFAHKHTQPGSAYGTSKIAMSALSRVHARTLADRGITVRALTLLDERLNDRAASVLLIAITAIIIVAGQCCLPGMVPNEHGGRQGSPLG